MERSTVIRPATPDDAEALSEIYAPYVTDTAITFEYIAPDKAEFEKRIEKTLERYPYIVAEKGGIIAGYAYTGPFKERAAYDRSVETSIYVAMNCRRGGIGKALYRELERISRMQNVTNMYACIACTDFPDGHLDNNSVEYHEHMGYKTVGKFAKCGFKFGTWYDMVFMEKIINDHSTAGEFIPYRKSAR